MTPKERAAMQQALGALENERSHMTANWDNIVKAITALREALDHSGEANEMVEFFSKEMKNKISVARAEQAEQEPSCNPHPDAPHGFDRNASHNAHRYVCECEGWEPEQADGEQWSPDDMAYRPGGLSMEQAEHEPVAWIEIERGIPMFAGFADNYKPNCDGFIPLYAAPVRTKDLTDDEISDAIHGKGSPLRLHDYAIRDFRAVIAADREKNK